MAVSLRGNVRDFGIAEVFQLIGQQRKTGVLEFTDGQERIQILFDGGCVVSASPVGATPESALADMLLRCGMLTKDRLEPLQRESAASAQSLARLAVASDLLTEKDLAGIVDLLTRETIFAVLRWQRGSFDFLSQDVEHDLDPGSLLGAEQILMDGLRMVDEWHSFAEQVPSGDIVFRRVAGFDAYLERRQDQLFRIREPAERVFSLVDGRLTVRRIVDLSRLGSFNATRILADLRSAGIIEPLDPEEVERRRARRRVVSVQPSELWTWVAGVVPLLLLATAALLVWRGSLAPPPGLDFALHRSPLQTAQQSFASRRVRHALEAFRITRGRWPVEPAELEAQRVLAGETLAPFAARAYYYAVREDGPLLLAPTR